MAQEERTGQRNLSYSLWHREISMSRFVGQKEAHNMHYYDIDGVESCYINGKCYPLFFKETAYYTKNPNFNKKPGVCLGTAELSNRPCFVVLYKLSKEKILKATLGNGDVIEMPDIEELFVKQFYPMESKWKRYAPEEWAKELLKMRKIQEVILRSRLLK
jgi:hypothetical protein